MSGQGQQNRLADFCWVLDAGDRQVRCCGRLGATAGLLRTISGRYDQAARAASASAFAACEVT
jgi:predicted MarR family transcription regulator